MNDYFSRQALFAEIYSFERGCFKGGLHEEFLQNKLARYGKAIIVPASRQLIDV